MQKQAAPERAAALDDYLRRSVRWATSGLQHVSCSACWRGRRECLKAAAMFVGAVWHGTHDARVDHSNFIRKRKLLGFFRKIIYFIKRKIHKTPGLYRLAFFWITFNLDFFRQLLIRSRFPSRFGGMWTDRDDFETQLTEKLRSGRVQIQDVPLLEQWHKEGFVVFPQCVPEDLVDLLVAEFDALPTHHPKGLKIAGGGELEARIYRPELVRIHESIRIVDYYFFSKTARELLFNCKTTEFIRKIFDADPILTQSLSFEFGSEQEMHRDTAFVIMNSPMKLAAIWIALEDVQEGSGELMYYPTSHRWGDFLFSGKFKHWDRERDGEQQLADWHAWLHEQARKRGIEPVKFTPKKGDIFVWHAGLAHGGAPIVNSTVTRRSLVGHFCPTGVRPLYHYYKPAHCHFYKIDDQTFSSSHYLPAEWNA